MSIMSSTTPSCRKSRNAPLRTPPRLHKDPSLRATFMPNSLNFPDAGRFRERKLTIAGLTVAGHGGRIARGRPSHRPTQHWRVKSVRLPLRADPFPSLVMSVQACGSRALSSSPNLPQSPKSGRMLVAMDHLEQLISSYRSRARASLAISRLRLPTPHPIGMTASLLEVILQLR